jgi:hypothetical protein
LSLFYLHVLFAEDRRTSLKQINQNSLEYLKEKGVFSKVEEFSLIPKDFSRESSLSNAGCN